MHVVFGGARNVVVDDVRDVVDVDPPRRDVGGHQDVHPAALEIGERAFALALAAVAVECRHRVAAGLESPREALGAVLGAGEHDRAVVARALEDRLQQIRLEMARDRVEELVDPRRRTRGRRQLEPPGVGERFARHGVELRRHRRREHQGLALLRQQSEDALEVRREAHVHHAVGFVEHQDLDVLEGQRLAAVEIQQPAGGRDQQFDALTPEHALLRTERHAAVHGADPHRREARVLARGGLDLRGELARGHEDQRPQGRWAVEQAREDGQHEGGGLAAAGLRSGDQVVAGKNERDGLRLDRRGHGVAGRPYALGNGLGQAECGERHDVS